MRSSFVSSLLSTVAAAAADVASAADVAATAVPRACAQVIIAVATGSPLEALARSISAKHLPLWEKLYDIVKLMKSTRVLSVSSIENLKRLGPEFVQMFRDTFPSESIPLKMHVIETHLGEWADMFGSIGLFSEEAAESIHHLIVRIERARGGLKGANLDRSIMNAIREQQDAANREADDERTERRKRPKKNAAADASGSAADAVASG